MSNIRTGKLVFASSVAAAVFILHGFSLLTIAVLMYALGTALVRGHQALTFVSIFLGGLSVISLGSTLGPAMLTVGAILAIAFSDYSVSRFSFFLSATAVLFSGTVEGALPLAGALLAASLPKRKMRRYLILAAGLSAVLLISGLPSPYEHPRMVSEEVFTDNGVLWPQPAELNLGSPELLLQDPGRNITFMTIQVSAGGVRDSNPVGFTTSGDRTFPINPGENIILIEEPEFPISIRICRQWKPFTHPVIHIDSAEASL